MYNLSELIKTDCCIDCGTNEKLREVLGKLTIPAAITQSNFGVMTDDTCIEIFEGEYATYCTAKTIPLTSINIDL